MTREEENKEYISQINKQFVEFFQLKETDFVHTDINDDNNIITHIGVNMSKDNLTNTQGHYVFAYDTTAKELYFTTTAVTSSCDNLGIVTQVTAEPCTIALTTLENIKNIYTTVIAQNPDQVTMEENK